MRYATETIFIVYLAALAALLAAAVAIWRLHCESFGCMGVGVAWFAWAIAFVIVLPIGLVARSKARPLPRLASLANMACWFQAVMGFAALATWFLRR
jgi:hypothetical protein